MSLVKNLAFFTLGIAHTMTATHMSELHYAVQLGDHEYVERCLTNTDPNNPGPVGWTPLHIAAMVHCYPDLRYMLETNSLSIKNRDELTVVQSRRRYIIRMLLEKGAIPKKRDHNNQKPLYYLGSCSDEEVWLLLGGKLRIKR